MSVALVPDSEAVTFGLEYDGPALLAHEMDIRVLAPALMSAGSLFYELNRTVNPTAPDVSVNVRATSEGSFLIELRLLFEIPEQALLTQPAAAAGTLVALLTGVGFLFSLAKKRQSTSEVSRRSIDRDGTVRLTFLDGTTLEIPAAILQASAAATIQRDLFEIVQPLNQDGIETVIIRREDVVIAQVDKAEAISFAALASTPRTILAMSEREVFLTIRTAGFASGRWSFSDGASSFVATVRDERFMANVHSGESFSELDVLRCLIRETQTRDERGLHAAVEVLEVREHLPPAQGRLDLDEPPGL